MSIDQENSVVFNGIEHFDRFDDEIVFWAELSNPPLEIQERAKEIDGSAYSPDCFGMCIAYEGKTGQFQTLTETDFETREKCNIYYIDNDGDRHWFHAELSEQFLQKVYEACGSIKQEKDRDVQRQAKKPQEYKYYSTQRPIDIGTYPKSDFNRPLHMDIYPTRQQVTGEAFQAWGAITYAQPLTEQEMRDYELRPSRDNLDIRRQMDAQAQVVGKWEDAHHVPEQRRLTWFYPDFGSYVAKEYVTPEQLTARARGVERQEAARAHKQEKGKQPIAEQLKAAQREAQADRGRDTPIRSAPDRGDR